MTKNEITSASSFFEHMLYLYKGDKDASTEAGCHAIKDIETIRTLLQPSPQPDTVLEESVTREDTGFQSCSLHDESTPSSSTIIKQPPVDNDHVAEGCEQFSEETIALNKKSFATEYASDADIESVNNAVYGKPDTVTISRESFERVREALETGLKWDVKSDEKRPVERHDIIASYARDALSILNAEGKV